MRRAIAIFVIVAAAFAMTSAVAGASASASVGTAAPAVVASKNSALCQVAVTTFGISVVTSAGTDGPLAWLGWAGVGIAFPGLARDCSLDAYWHHVGHRVLCWEPYFIGWSSPDSGDGNVHSVYAPAPACQVSAKTADGVLCQYLHPAQYEQACTKQFLDALAWYNWSHISPW